MPMPRADWEDPDCRMPWDEDEPPLDDDTEPEEESPAHTPGPWMVKHAGNQDEIWSDHGVVAELPLYPHGIKVARANANLIARAPELENALESLVNWSILRSDWYAAGQPEPPDHPIAVARAAINKAKGK